VNWPYSEEEYDRADDLYDQLKDEHKLPWDLYPDLGPTGHGDICHSDADPGL